jgi:hypothetical protein
MPGVPKSLVVVRMQPQKIDESRRLAEQNEPIGCEPQSSILIFPVSSARPGQLGTTQKGNSKLSPLVVILQVPVLLLRVHTRRGQGAKLGQSAQLADTISWRSPKCQARCVVNSATVPVQVVRVVLLGRVRSGV